MADELLDDAERILECLPVVDLPCQRFSGDFYSYKLTSVYWVLREIDQSGDWAQFGVYRGRIAKALAPFLPKKRTFHLFDSFQGLPEDWVGKFKKGAFRLNENQIPSFDSENIVVHKGWFNETLPVFLNEQTRNLSFLHIDCDLYSSTIDVLTQCNSLIKPGAVLLFDEYIMRLASGESDAGEHRALVEWKSKFRRRIHYLWRTSWYQVCVKVLQ